MGFNFQLKLSVMHICRLSLLIGLRFSSQSRRKGMVSLVSIICTIGIALGVAVLIIGLSALNGFERELNHRILSVIPQGEIFSVNYPMYDWPKVLSRIIKVSGVSAAAPYVTFTGLIENNVKLAAVQIKGIDLLQEQQVNSLFNYITWEHSSNFILGKQQIILGEGVATALNVHLSDWVTLLLPHQDSQLKLLQPQRIRLQVVGILQLGGILDHNIALVTLKEAQKYQNIGSGVTGIAIKLQDPYDAEQVVRDAGKAAQTYVYIRSWQTAYGYIFHDIQTIRALMYLAMLSVIGIACFNIVSTLMVAVKNKSKDIAVLRTMGANNSLISGIFVWYGLLVGIIGGLGGIIIGTIVSLQLTKIASFFEFKLGHQLLSSDVYPINFLPTELHWQDVIHVFVMTIILSLVASWYPAQRAIRLPPAQI